MRLQEIARCLDTLQQTARALLDAAAGAAGAHRRRHGPAGRLRGHARVGRGDGGRIRRLMYDGR